MRTGIRVVAVYINFEMFSPRKFVWQYILHVHVCYNARRRVLRRRSDKRRYCQSFRYALYIVLVFLSNAKSRGINCNRQQQFVRILRYGVVNRPAHKTHSTIFARPYKNNNNSENRNNNRRFSLRSLAVFLFDDIQYITSFLKHGL